jgi:subtilisin family serine protease
MVFVCMSTMAIMAQRPAATFPVIVIFHEDAPFDSFAPGYRADARSAADPDAWGYLNRGVAGAVQALEARQGFRAEQVYSAALRGFSAQLTARQIADLEDDPSVAYIEPDGEMQIFAQILPWGIDKVAADLSSTQAGNGSGAITNVNVYIIDTGIFTHADLNRFAHVNFAGGKNDDCHGHGTHVAGTVSARDNTSDVVGVAPGAKLTGVKVLGCNGSGSTSGVIKGVDWVTANAKEPAVANMSLGGSVSQALDDAVKRSAASGVFYALAAGNSGANACNSSPARTGAGTNNGIMTVAATDSTDREASWSNYGSCVDIWAPGVSILSTRRGGGTTTMSGTSMASPHVAGGGALYLSTHTDASPSSVEAALKAAAMTATNKSKDGGTITRLYVRDF